MKVDVKQLSKFLVKAKINTYASSGESGEKILPNGSKEFEFEEKEFKYRDRYFGYNPFIGEEIIWQSKKIVWGMNYYGEIVSKIIPTKEIYQSLQEALKKLQMVNHLEDLIISKKTNLNILTKLRERLKNLKVKKLSFIKNNLCINYTIMVD